jgi:hypothetical protein
VERVPGILTLGSVSGRLTTMDGQDKILTVSTVSGRMALSDIACERLMANSASGGIDYSRSLAPMAATSSTRNSGLVTLTLPSTAGFELSAGAFSGRLPHDHRGDGRDYVSGGGRALYLRHRRKRQGRASAPL